MAADALAAGKDVHLEKPVTHTLEQSCALTHAVRFCKQICSAAWQQRSWQAHFRDAVDMIEGGSLGRITQARTYWWQNHGRVWESKPIDRQALQPPVARIGSRVAVQSRKKLKFGAGSGGLAAAPRPICSPWDRCGAVGFAIRLAKRGADAGDNIYEAWDCPDTVQAAFRYPDFDVVYEGMMEPRPSTMAGIQFRGTEATLKINRGGLAPHREGVPSEQNPVLAEKSYRDASIAHMENFFDCVRSRQNGEPNTWLETGVPRRAQAKSATWPSVSRRSPRSAAKSLQQPRWRRS